MTRPEAEKEQPGERQYHDHGDDRQRRLADLGKVVRDDFVGFHYLSSSSTWVTAALTRSLL